MTKLGNTKRVLVRLVVWGALASGLSAAAPDPYAPLWLYNGSWQITRNDQPAGAAPDKLTNQCALAGHYFVCDQTVNGGPGALLVFIPTDKPGHYYTQNIRPEGRATGRGDLEIQGNTWIFSSTWDTGGGHTVYYRTTNVFKGRGSIHFEQAESPDNKTWTVKNSGEEVRVGGSGAKP